ncbi:MAG: T9SS type A sorting domain-containing protein [candidate division KSB1 bacterium]|nr:T9SS type A sorting domain-containing protein [candidate division KSB1 bacterium]
MTRINGLDKSLLWMFLILFVILVSGAEAQMPAYPTSKPEVIEADDRLTVLFPQQVGLVLERQPGQFFSGLSGLWVGKQEILSLPVSYRFPPELVLISDDSVGGIDNWQSYLMQRLANQYQWPPVGGRDIQALSLETATYLGYEVREDSVVIRCRMEALGESGELQWIFSPWEWRRGEETYRGLGWKVRLIGLHSAMWLRWIEPIQTRPGDWVLAQTWGQWIENRVGNGPPLMIESKWYFGDIQPFYFASGGQGTAISFFDEVTATIVEIQEEAGRHFMLSQIPLGTGNIRETPMKFWLWSDHGHSSKWEVINEWTRIFDALAETYRQQMGLGKTRPKPTLFWGAPDDDYFLRYRAGIQQPFWLDTFRTQDLPQLAQLGFRVVFFHTPWESDADHLEQDYLPGSGSFGSANAPWSFEVSPSIGGADRMRSMIEKAHELAVKVVLWSSPGHLSNSAPLLAQNTDWIKWRASGVPEDFDWGDVTGTSPFSGYFDYALREYRRTVAELRYDGIWQDSFLTFGVLPDYRVKQPEPSLHSSLAIQKELWRLGMTEIYIEGCGPLGVSTGGYGHEPPIPEDLQKIRDREYGLYSYIADVYPEPDAYYRALASGGAIGVANLAELKKLPEETVKRIVQANFDYLSIMNKMQYRRLIGEGNTWLGVEWSNDAGPEKVVFSFTSFQYPSHAGTLVQDVTTGDVFRLTDNLQTRAFHTYLVGATVTGVSQPLPFTFSLAQNYPNPFNPETTIRYQIPRAGHVLLAVYDVLGREICRLIDAPQHAGHYATIWDARNTDGRRVASGIYFYELWLDGEQKVRRKMIFLR